MFTGIIERLGAIAALEAGPAGGRLRIDAGPLTAALALGSSVAVNGCCLTVVELSGVTFAADLSKETLLRASFGQLRPGALVNLERPLAAGAPLGGHFVQGHVDAVGRVLRLAPETASSGQDVPAAAQNWRLSVELPAEIERYVATKGSIAIDGISLTVASLRNGIAEAAIIPFTYANTNIQALAPGSPINLEVDILAKYIERLSESRLAPAPTRWTIERLRKEGF